VVIPGNHDEAAERQEGAWRDTLAGIPGVSVLINQGVEISGVSFWGSPYTPQFMDWSFMLPPDRLAAVWEQIPSCDVLVTHGPPHRVLDAATRSRRVEHVGCPILARRVQLLQPKLHLYGHIHPAYGVREFGETRCLNSSVVDDCLDLIHGAQVVEI
jgi:Icc-related predicted phosphoesterase